MAKIVIYISMIAFLNELNYLGSFISLIMLLNAFTIYLISHQSWGGRRIRDLEYI